MHLAFFGYLSKVNFLCLNCESASLSLRWLICVCIFRDEQLSLFTFCFFFKLLYSTLTFIFILCFGRCALQPSSYVFIYSDIFSIWLFSYVPRFDKLVIFFFFAFAFKLGMLRHSLTLLQWSVLWFIYFILQNIIRHKANQKMERGSIGILVTVSLICLC